MRTHTTGLGTMEIVVMRAQTSVYWRHLSSLIHKQAFLSENLYVKLREMRSTTYLCAVKLFVYSIVSNDSYSKDSKTVAHTDKWKHAVKIGCL